MVFSPFLPTIHSYSEPGCNGFLFQAMQGLSMASDSTIEKMIHADAHRQAAVLVE